MNEDTSLNPICLLSRSDAPTFSLFHSFFLAVNETRGQRERATAADTDTNNTPDNATDKHKQRDNHHQENERDSYDDLDPLSTATAPDSGMGNGNGAPLDCRILFRVPANRDRLDDIETAVKYFALNVSPLKKEGNDLFGTFVITTSDGSRFYAIWRGSPTLLLIAISIFPLITFTRKLFYLLADEHANTLSPILRTLCEFPILGCASLCYEIQLHSGSLTLNFNEFGLADDDDMNTIAVRLFSPQMLVDIWEALILEHKVLVISSNPAVVPYCCEFLRRLILPLVLINTYVPYLPEELLSTIEAPFPYLVGAQSDMVYQNRIDLSDTFVVDIDGRLVQYPHYFGEGCRAPLSMKTKAIQEMNALCLQPLAHWVGRTTQCKTSLNQNHPHSPENLRRCADGILKCFIQLNLSLFAARHCDVRAFYRRCERPLAGDGSRSREPFHLPKHRGPNGRVSSMGFSYRSGVVCGCMQLLNERKDIDVLQFLPCWVEMDSVVFSVYEYADELPLIFFHKKDIVAVSPSPAEPEGHVFDLQIGSQISYRFAATDPDSRRLWIKEIEKASSQRLMETKPIAPPNSPQTPHPFSQQSSGLSVQSEPFTPHPFHQQTSGLSVQSEPYIPHPFHAQPSGISIQSEGDLEDDHQIDIDIESHILAQFRSKIVQTQMVSFFKSRSEFPEYGSMLNEQNMTYEDVTIGKAYGGAIDHDHQAESHSQRVNSTDGTEGSYEDQEVSVKYKLISDSDTTLCSDAVIQNIKSIWGLYVSGELVFRNPFDDVTYRGRDRDNKRKGVSIRKSNLNTESAAWLIQSPVSQAASLTFLAKQSRDYNTISKLHRAALEADILEQKCSRESGSWSMGFLKSLLSSNEADFALKKNEAREDLNKAIKEELLLRCAAGELLQRVSATHRQCEADLRKLIVHMKMKSIADIIDVNSPLRTDGIPRAVVLVNIEKVAAASQTDMSPAQREYLRSLSNQKKFDWQQRLKQWYEVLGRPPSLPSTPTSELSPRQRRKSVQQILLSAHLQQVSSSLEAIDETNMMPSLSFSGNPNSMDQDDEHLTRHEIRESMTTRPHLKKNYSSPETDCIRRLIKVEIENQLEKSSQNDAEIQEKVLIPVLHALNGYVCGRLAGQERVALNAYATGALGDQVRIMRALVHIFLSFIKDRDSCDDPVYRVRTQVSTDITDHGAIADYLQSLSYSDGEARFILNSQQVSEFLNWAATIGDIVGLQAVRFLTELIHRCLSKRMAQRCLEQSENLPVQSFGDSTLNEFKREVTHGIYSRRRVSLSNMQPSFIWVDVADKKSDVLNEVVMCTMSAAKPCELSIQLLNSLRELLRTLGSDGTDAADERGPIARQTAGCHHVSFISRLYDLLDNYQLVLSDVQRENLAASSAFRSFELQTSQLQLVDLLSLDDNSRIVFFSNIFNVISVHAIITRGYTGTGFYDKCNFMRMAKYNLSGQIFNLLEIEHTILRAQTSSPNSIVGPFIHVSERSPKSVYALKKPIPLISFTLFFACYSSPPLTTLWEPSSVQNELRRAACTYLLTHARVDSATKSLLLPEIFKWYWRDFGENKKAVLNTVLHLVGKESWLYQDIVKHVDLNKPKISHVPFDWRFVMIL